MMRESLQTRLSGAAATAVLAGAFVLGGCTMQGSSQSYEPVQPLLADDDTFKDGAKRPPTAETLYRTARLFLNQNREPQAEQTLQACIDRYPAYAPAYNELAQLHVRRGDLARATEILSQGVQQAPGDAVLQNSMGMCLLLQDRPAEGLVYFTRAGEIDPTEIRYRTNVALATGMSGRYDESLALYAKTLGEGNAHYNVAVICEARQDFQRAATEYARAAELGVTRSAN